MYSKLTRITVAFFILLSTNMYAQNSGFIGKKNILSVDVNLSNPMFFNLFNRDTKYRYNENSPTPKSGNNLLTRGLNIAVGRTLSNQFAFHLQASVLDYKTNLDDITFYEGTLEANYIFRSTFFRNRAIGIMPIIEYSNSSGGILPLGLSHQIGVGFYNNRPLKKDYQITHNNSLNETETLDGENLFDYDNYRIRSYSFMYKINLRMAINRSILFNLGFRYNLNMTRDGILYPNENEQFTFTESDYRNLVAKGRRWGIISLETGLSFVF